MISREDVEHVAALARLGLTDDEIDLMQGQLNRILEAVGQLQAVDTANVAPMAHPLDRAQRLREDVVTETDRRELYQRNAARVERGLYLVPKVID